MASKKKPKNQAEEAWMSKKIFALIALAIFSAVFIYSFLITDTTVRYDDLKTVYAHDGSYSLNVPKQMEQTQLDSDILDYHDKNTDSQQSLSHVRVESQYFGDEQFSETKSLIIDQLKAKKGDYYDVFIKKATNGPISDQLKFSDFSSENNESAYADFSYKSGQTTVSGRLLVTFSQDTMFFVVAEATNEIWYENLSVWNSVINSFKAN